MKPLRNMLDRLQPHFSKGGRFERLEPLFEAVDTFMYTPGTVTSGPTHLRDSLDLKRMMTVVVIALLPCMAMAMYNTGLQANGALATLGLSSAQGWRAVVIGWLGTGYDPSSVVACVVHGALYFLPVYIVTVAVGGAWEVLFSIVRKHEVNEGFFVTSALFPLTLPATIPLWQVALGISFGVVIGKEVFGGTGRNWLNPALTSRAFLFFAYPAQISGDAVWTAVDGFSSATPLGAAAAGGLSAVTADISLQQAFFGTIQGSMGETSTIACLIGAAILLLTRIGSWRIMTAVVIGSLAMASLFYGLGSTTNVMFSLPPHWHLVLGGYAFGLVFMATDPVSAAMTRGGKWIYGLLIGCTVILIRVVNPAFPEGMMLAILLGNCFAPLIDHYVVKANVRRRRLRYAKG